MKKKIIVTGGAGFLGTHLCRKLRNEGHQVKVIDLKENPEFDTIIADIRDRNAMLEHLVNADAVFHLAALIEAGESVKFPQNFVDVNVSGSISVLEAMRHNGIKAFFFSSSAAVYGEPQHIPIKEDDRTIPINPYGMTKLALEALASSYVSAHGFTSVALRYFNLYGPEEKHQPETHAIPRFIQQIHESKDITVWGQGEHERDFIYIDDVVDAHLKALELADREPEKYHYFNISAEQPTKIITVIETIKNEMATDAKITYFPPRPGDPLILAADATKAREVLGWKAQVSLEQGIRQTVSYFKSVWQET